MAASVCPTPEIRPGLNNVCPSQVVRLKSHWTLGGIDSEGYFFSQTERGRGSHGAGKFFQYVDEPGCGLQDRQTLGELLLAINIIEQLERTFIAGMSLRKLAELAQPRTQFRATRLQVIVLLAEALPFPGH